MISIVFAFHRTAFKNHEEIVRASELVFYFKSVLKPKLIYILYHPRHVNRFLPRVIKSYL